ncbi:secreted frizzled-related protein 2 [Geospiza fortis]|uniref:Secreted frizzled-related protein 2 n=1 Tax=Geospiza fortis TaxID=48883 RepID=A0A8N5EIL0_GEOFO|nr:secreted frizzled-related protein 2 [Geospiza fortis]
MGRPGSGAPPRLSTGERRDLPSAPGLRDGGTGEVAADQAQGGFSKGPGETAGAPSGSCHRPAPISILTKKVWASALEPRGTQRADRLVRESSLDGVSQRVPNATCCSFLPGSDGHCCLAFAAPKVCDACKNKNEDDNDIVENLCKNDFALKIKVKEIAYINGDTKITPETKSKTIYKLNGLTERDLRKIVLWLKGGLQCTCDEMNDINVPYLVMGQKQAGELVITSLKRWQKGQRAFKRFSRSIRKLQC